MPSIFDEIYREFFGGSLTKEGQAFERIAAAVAKIVAPNADVAHDQKLRGEVSQSLYQIDVFQSESGEQQFGEAKDYTVQKKKVGRADLQKLAGALGDVAVDKGAMYSATDYTKPAKQYAQGAKQIANKEIDLYHVRPSSDTDIEGRIWNITVNLHLDLQDNAHAVFTAIWTPDAKAALIAKLGINTQLVQVPVTEFYDRQGRQLTTLYDVTLPGFSNESRLSQGCLLLREHFIKYEGELLELIGMEYSVPYINKTVVLEISGGKPRILVKTENGAIDKLVTEDELKRISFDEAGNVVQKQ